MGTGNGRALETRSIAGHGGKLGLPKPPQRPGRRGKADEVGLGPGGKGVLLCRRQRLVRGGEAAAQKQDVAGLDGRPLLPLQNSFEIVDGDVGGLERFRGDGPGTAVARVVDEHAAANDAPLVDPRVDADDAGRVQVVHGDAAVELLGLLVAVVAEAVPLAGALGIEREVVVVDGTVGAGGGLADDALPLERGAVKAGLVGAVEVPVEGHAVAGPDFLGGLGDGVGREHVERAEVVVGAVEAPGVARRPGLVERQATSEATDGETGD
ncbi:hypothetical protein F503_06736 [Ophiostoma piceae UAMH 11346]|uniref:Uncharacterized protein n=1 Tax=Ophiostoma piceae (strain UAMH 11346) TaxID=1262450 RepID=S3CBC4_OPHP1|nr:hypothetical protein F503_06736 [Ophiostoma piceae UAMH 11346]